MIGRNVLKYASVFLAVVLMFSSATSIKLNVNEDKMETSSPVTVTLSDGGASSNTLEVAPYIWELTERHIGKHTLTVTAYDHGGLSSNITLDMIIYFNLVSCRR